MRGWLVGGLAGVGLVAATVGTAVEVQPQFSFPSIDGGSVDLADWRGGPVLVVNTASLCGYAGQYNDLQALHDRYGARGLHVLAVPSDDFAQELDSAAEVKEYCAVNFDLTLPMTDITPVLGEAAHPFYRWMAEAHDFAPRWNFNKVLLSGDGSVDRTWGSSTPPLSDQIIARIEALLP